MSKTKTLLEEFDLGSRIIAGIEDEEYKKKWINNIKNLKENIEWLDKHYWELRDDGHYEEAFKALDIYIILKKLLLKLYEEEDNRKNEQD